MGLLGRELASVTTAQVEEEVHRLRLSVILDLRQERRHEVEGAADLRVAVEQGRHLVVVLGTAKPDPRQEIGRGEVVLVIRLVHVPDKRDMYWFVHMSENLGGFRSSSRSTARRRCFICYLAYCLRSRMKFTDT